MGSWPFPEKSHRFDPDDDDAPPTQKHHLILLPVTAGARLDLRDKFPTCQVCRKRERSEGGWARAGEGLR